MLYSGINVKFFLYVIQVPIGNSNNSIANCTFYLSKKSSLMIFERKIMRKVFGPTRTDDGYWRIKTKQEMNDLLKAQNTIGFIKKTKIKLVRSC